MDPQQSDERVVWICEKHDRVAEDETHCGWFQCDEVPVRYVPTPTVALTGKQQQDGGE